ncbi:hypothetical protein [Paenibacillus tianjinensis]|uniref:Uncharacterized protein n=1 Tax=Paenibacillus tianjinensis TaxID=2810347 RepID=A0ABX7L980_9BACL|nr:hypothetical protein [Paenibacillus tianjinensis]QSF43259.1 hypothetical protein JRJ22_18505 [Paenibacillus tianjinensis]
MNSNIEHLIGEMEPKERNNEMYFFLVEFIIKSGNYFTFTEYLESQKEVIPLEVYGYLAAGMFNQYHSYIQELKYLTEELDEENYE